MKYKEIFTVEDKNIHNAKVKVISVFEYYHTDLWIYSHFPLFANSDFSDVSKISELEIRRTTSNLAEIKNCALSRTKSTG